MNQLGINNNEFLNKNDLNEKDKIILNNIIKLRKKMISKT